MSIFTRLAYWLGLLGIKQRLIILVLLTVAPLAALIVWHAATDRAEAIRHAGLAARQSARLAALRQSAALTEAISVLEGMRSTPAISVAGGDACRHEVTRLRRQHPSFATIGVVRLDGLVVCHSLLDAPRSVGHQEVLKEAFRPDAPDTFVSHLLDGPITGQPVVFVAKPLRSSSGAKLGVVYVSLHLKAFSELADRSTVGETRATIVLEPDTGIVLARSEGSGLKLGSIFPDRNLLNAMRANPGGRVRRGHTQWCPRNLRLCAASRSRDFRRHGRRWHPARIGSR